MWTKSAWKTKNVDSTGIFSISSLVELTEAETYQVSGGLGFATAAAEVLNANTKGGAGGTLSVSPSSASASIGGSFSQISGGPGALPASGRVEAFAAA